jgi:hypothetical protein
MTGPAWAFLLAAAIAILPALARGADIDPQAQRGPAPRAAPAGINVFAPPDAACREWTDGCRVCRQPPSGEVACSNVATACVQQAPRCTRR